MENTREDVIDLDLNEEPTDPSHGSPGSAPSELEITYRRIDERIRRLEAVTSRVLQRHRWRLAQEASEARNVSITQISSSHVDSEPIPLEHGVGSQEGIFENAKECKSSAHLIAKALEMESDEKNTGGLFDCNICLRMARDPIVTCCGHLFCWPCFYQLSNLHSNMKECPVCRGKVTDETITPIYGSENDAHKSRLEDLALKVPPRPNAHRVESIRQQQVNGATHIFPLEEAMLFFSNRINATWEPIPHQNLDAGHMIVTTERPNIMETPSTSQVLRGTTAEDGQHTPSIRVPQSQPSLTSLPPASSPVVLPTRSQPLLMDDGYSLSSIAAVMHSESQNLNTATAETNSALPYSASSSGRRSYVSAAVSDIGNQITDSSTEGNLTVPCSSSSSSRGRPDVLGSSGAASREPRRRRLQ